jgi:hypothetical protein
MRGAALFKDIRVIASAAIGLVVGFLIAALVFGKPWHLLPNWGDIPTWLAVVVATAGGWLALSQLRDQKEVLAQDAQDRRRAQAARVFIGAPRAPGGWVHPYVKNASDFPIYEAEFWYLSPDGMPDLHRPEYFGTILPGEDPYGERGFPSKDARASTILTFRDANNVCWIRMSHGVLEEQPAPTAQGSVRAMLRTPPGARPRARGNGGDEESTIDLGGGSSTRDSGGTGGAGTGSGPSGGGSKNG